MLCTVTSWPICRNLAAEFRYRSNTPGVSRVHTETFCLLRLSSKLGFPAFWPPVGLVLTSLVGCQRKRPPEHFAQTASVFDVNVLRLDVLNELQKGLYFLGTDFFDQNCDGLNFRGRIRAVSRGSCTGPIRSLGHAVAGRGVF